MGKRATVLKFKRNDHPGYVLVNTYSRGSKPLDLQLEATEGEEHYGLPLRHDKVASLRIENCPASESEWQDILTKLFQQEPLHDINATASVRDGKAIDIVVRKEIQEVTQRLGEISIVVAKNAEYDVLDWCATAADAAEESKLAAWNAMLKVEQMEATIADLKRQLDELITSKAEDETSLLSKFRDLLNEKKVKIREQQKIIASRSTMKDASASSASQPSQTNAQDRGHVAGKSRAGKRKAKDTPVKDEEASSEDGFEPMEVEKDNAGSDAEETDRGDETDATASNASDDEENQDSKPASPPPQPAPKQAKSQPPPPRSLPFAKTKPQPAASKAPVRGADSETESDDEL